MVRDSKGSHDGWFWGWYGWAGLGLGGRLAGAKPAAPTRNMGFGQYCTNCHASAKDNQTFAALKNIKGEPGKPLVFLSQNFFLDPSWQSLPARASRQRRRKPAPRPTAGKRSAINRAFTKIARPSACADACRASRDAIFAMPPDTYDNVWVKPGAPTAQASSSPPTNASAATAPAAPACSST